MCARFHPVPLQDICNQLLSWFPVLLPVESYYQPIAIAYMQDLLRGVTGCNWFAIWVVFS